MIKQVRTQVKDYVIEEDENETPENRKLLYTVTVGDTKQSGQQHTQQSLIEKINHNLITLSCKQQVKSLCSNSSQLSPKQSMKHSDDMDIDQENDIVNDLSYIEQLDKAEQQDQLLATLSAKDRILYANSKKHQGNECFRQNNLEDAIEAYKVGLSLLKPQSFMSAAASDCLAMAQLTSNILFNMGTCYFILMSCRYAIKFYDQAILIKPNYTKAIHNRALCQLQQSNLLAAFNDIRLAYQLDRHNASIQADYKRIEVEYCRVYRHHMSEGKGLGVRDDVRVMSKSMIAEPTTVVSQFNVENDANEEMGKGDTSASVIFEGQAKIGQMTSLEQKAREVKEETSQTQSQKLTRQKIRSFYGNRFYKNNQVKCNKPWMKQFTRPIVPSCIGSPKFRPYILNSTAKQPICLKKQPKFPDPNLLDLQNSAGELFQRQRRINLLKDKIHTIQRKDNTQRRNNTEEDQREKIKKRRSRQKSIEGKDQDKFWGYIPIVVATGFGLYHSLRAVLGK